MVVTQLTGKVNNTGLILHWHSQWKMSEFNFIHITQISLKLTCHLISLSSVASSLPSPSNCPSLKMGKLPTISLEITNQSRQHSLWMLVKAHRTNKGDWLKVLFYSGFLPNWYTPTQPVSSRLQNYVINFCLIAKQAYISYLITI